MTSRRDFLAGTAQLLGAFALTPSAPAGQGPGGARGEDGMRAQSFIAAHEKTVRPLERAAALTWWNANVSGKDDDFAAKEEAQNRLDEALADKARFAELKAV